MAAGTVVITETVHGSVKKIRAAFVAGTDGDAGTASGTTAHAYDGKVIALVTDPDDALAPDDNWDLVVTDADGDDVLAGAGANRDTANTEIVASASLGAVAGTRLTISVTNAGSGEAGVVTLWIR